MIITTTVNNEVSINEVRRLISEGVISGRTNVVTNYERSYYSTFAGLVTVQGEDIKLYAGDEVIVHNVTLPVAVGDPGEFSCSITIN